MRSELIESERVALRVLCIDDDRRLYELLASYLGDNGVHLEHAPDGRQGLATLERGVFDAVLLDVMMPGMDGLEVCRRVREKSRIPIIMLTGRGDETDRVVGLELGADDYVPKPFSPRELLARLRAVLRRTAPAGEPPLVVGTVSVDLQAREVRVAGVVTESDRTVDVHVSHLRRKLGDDPRAPRLIKTVRGVGYVLARELVA